MSISELLNHSFLSLIVSPAITDQNLKNLPRVKSSAQYPHRCCTGERLKVVLLPGMPIRDQHSPPSSLCDVDSIQCCQGTFCSQSLHHSPKNSSPESSHKSLSLHSYVATCQDESDSCLTATVPSYQGSRHSDLRTPVGGPCSGSKRSQQGTSLYCRQTGQFHVAGALPWVFADWHWRFHRSAFLLCRLVGTPACSCAHGERV